MAKFEMQLPEDVIKDITYIENRYKDIFGGMTEAGAKLVFENVMNNLPQGIKDSEMAGCVHVSRTYLTPSDDGINNKVYIAGYFTNHLGVKTPAPLVANMFEYGSNSRNFPKQPFFRKSFKKQQIEQVMLAEQIKLSKGILNE